MEIKKDFITFEEIVEARKWAWACDVTGNVEEGVYKTIKRLFAYYLKDRPDILEKISNEKL